MRKYVHIYDESLRPLCNAIIAQAIKDYTNEPDSHVGADAKTFMKSDWFFQLSDGLDGDAVLARLDRKMKEFQELCKQHVPKVWKDSKEAHECQFSCPFCNGKVKIVWNDRKNAKMCKSYCHQCEGCGVRQTFVFNGIFTKPEERKHTCKDCQWYKPGRTRQATCVRHSTNTTPTAFCENYMKRVYKE